MNWCFKIKLQYKVKNVEQIETERYIVKLL